MEFKQDKMTRTHHQIINQLEGLKRSKEAKKLKKELISNLKREYVDFQLLNEANNLIKKAKEKQKWNLKEKVKQILNQH